MNEEKNVYVVDDDVSVCRSLGILLETYGFSPELFSSGESFLEAVPFDVPGCLVLDIHMPGMDGWETLEQVIRSGSKRPVIIVSADKNGGLRERALVMGAVGFLHKPFNNQELFDLIEEVFKNKKT